MSSANRKPRSPQPEAPQSEFGRLARKLSELRKLYDRLDEADYEARTSTDGRAERIKAVQSEAYDRAEALREYLAYVEPESLEDLAAQTVLIYELFDIFDDQYTDPALGPSASCTCSADCECSDVSQIPRPQRDDQDRRRYRRDLAAIKAMLSNMLRALARHAQTSAIGWQDWETGFERAFSDELAAVLAEGGTHG